MLAPEFVSGLEEKELRFAVVLLIDMLIAGRRKIVHGSEVDVGKLDSHTHRGG